MMNRLVAYARESYNELRFKVTWPTWPELQSSTVIVLVASLMIALAVFAMDWVSSNILDLFYGLF